MGNEKALRYARDFSIPLSLARILAQRFPEHSRAREFLHPRLNNLHPPELVPDIESAVELILNTIGSGEGILIYCHDDLDGYTSAAIVFKTFLDLQWHSSGPVYFYAIDRDKDGYIINPQVLKKYQEKGVSLILTVDFGISNNENFYIPQKMGFKLIVCDHHETELNRFPAPALDPKRADSKYPFRELAGVGVAFKLVQMLYQNALGLKPTEFYEMKKEFFSIAMLGTIADRVPPTDENRIFCHYGLKFLDELDAGWINYFKKKGKISLKMVTREIIPVISSSAYLQPAVGVEVFINNNSKKVAEIITRLEEMNQKRIEQTKDIFKDALNAAQVYPEYILSILTTRIRHHYIGVVASRIRDHFQRTAIIIGIKGNICIGELRSNDIDLFKLLSQFNNLFLDFGGHKRAAGFSMEQKNLERFIEELPKFIANQRHNSNKVQKSYEAEAVIKKSDIHILEPIMPFGETNPAPILTDGVSIYTIDNKFRIIEMG